MASTRLIPGGFTANLVLDFAFTFEELDYLISSPCEAESKARFLELMKHKTTVDELPSNYNITMVLTAGGEAMVAKRREQLTQIEDRKLEVVRNEEVA